MKKQIKEISVSQTAKVIAILYAIIGLIYSVIGLLMVLFGDGEAKITGTMFIFMPLFLGVFGFLFGALFCWLYNVVAQKFGGIEFTLEDVE